MLRYDSIVTILLKITFCAFNAVSQYISVGVRDNF